MPVFHLHIQKLLQGNFQLMDINVAFVFQVNCPGCFMYGIPLVNGLFEKFNKETGFIGVSTAFEDFDLNTEANTLQLLKTGKLIGETGKYFNSVGIERFTGKILFPVAFDVLKPAKEFLTDENILTVCNRNQKFTLLSSEERQTMLMNVREYYSPYRFIAETFTLNQLQGTPSFIIFDNQYNLLQSFFGYQDKELLESFLNDYLSASKIIK